MANCNEYLEMLSSLIDGELDSRQEAELCAHIETCENCKRVYTAFKSISDATSDELVQPPEMLAKGIMFKINAKENSGGKRRFAFGRFTAMAACLALIILGASRLGLFDSVGDKAASAKSADPSVGYYTNDESDPVYESSVLENSGAAFVQPTDGSNEQEPPQSADNYSLTEEGGTAIQMAAPENVKLKEVGKPPCLYDAKEISFYEGNYIADITASDYKTPLFTVTEPAQLEMFAILLGEMLWTKNGEATPPPEIPKDDPLYTLFIPANLEADENSKDTAICIWIIDDELWCLEKPLDQYGAAITPIDLSSQPKLYKPVALSKELDDFLKIIKEIFKVM